MGHCFLFLSAVGTCLLWSAAFVAIAARTDRSWLRRLLVTVAAVVPPLALAPLVVTTWLFAVMLRLGPNWFPPTIAGFLAAFLGGLGIAVAGLRHSSSGRIAAAWPVGTLAAMAATATMVAFGALIAIDTSVSARGWALRIEAAQIMAASMPPDPSADDDASPIYRRAFAAIDADAQLFAEGSPAATPTTADTRSREVDDILRRHAATLELVRRAADRPECRFIRDWSRPAAFETVWLESAKQRSAALLLSLAARHEAAHGDAAAAIRDILRVHRIATHAAAEPTLASLLYGQTIDKTAFSTLATILPSLAKDDLPLLDGAGFRDFLETPFSCERHFLWEEATGLAALADVASPPPGQSTVDIIRSLSGDEHLESFIEGPLSCFYRCFMFSFDMAGYVDTLRRLQCIAGSMGGASPRSLPKIEAELTEIATNLKEHPAGIFCALTPPPLTRIPEFLARGEALRAAAEVLVATTRERLASGTIAETVADLVPTRLASLPADPFTLDRPLRSKRAEGLFVVYSIGPDGEDDGGPAAPGTESEQGNDDIGLFMQDLNGAP